MAKPFIHIAMLLLVGCLVVPMVSHAEQAQYFYDEVGRPVAVVDRQVNLAV